MGLDLAAEAGAVSATLRALAPTEASPAEVAAGLPASPHPRAPSAPELTAVPVIRTSRPFYGARAGAPTGGCP